jgi:hypothetical protein
MQNDAPARQPAGHLYAADPPGYGAIAALRQ